MSDIINPIETKITISEEESKGTIVVIMPFNKLVIGSTMNFDTIYDLFIERTITELKYLPYRIDRIDSAEEVFISKRIFKPLCNIENYVLADLTDGNPNVLYELGVRHALVRTGAILIIQEGKEIPFYFKDQELIKYSPGLENRDKFKNAIEKLINKKKGGLSPIPVWIDDYNEILDQTSEFRKKNEELSYKLIDKENELEKRKNLDDIIVKMHKMLEQIHQEIIKNNNDTNGVVNN